MRQKSTNNKGALQIWMSRLRHTVFPESNDSFYPRPKWFHYLRNLFQFFWLIPSFLFLTFLNNYYLSEAFSDLNTIIQQKGFQALLNTSYLFHALQLDLLSSLLSQHKSFPFLILALLFFSLIGYWAKRDRQREKTALTQYEESEKEQRKREEQFGESQKIVEEIQKIHYTFEPRLPPLFDESAARVSYIVELRKRYNYVTLPIGPTIDVSLQTVFQPLKLRRDPLAAWDLVDAKRRNQVSKIMEMAHQMEQENLSHSPVIVDNGDDALSKSTHGRIIILGGPGTGKTTVLKSFIADRARKALSNPTAPIPIFVSLPDLATSGNLLDKYLIRTIKTMKIEDRCVEILQKAIKNGNAFICLDSLDEVLPSLRPEIIKIINEMASHSGNTWIVGSRFTEYKGGQFKRGQFTEWELQPMNHDLRQQMAQRLLPEVHALLQDSIGRGKQEAGTFVELLENHNRAATWGENPLFFSLALVVFVYTGTLPISRAMLYQQVIDTLIEIHEPDATRRRILRRVLADLALELYKTKGRTFTNDDLLTLIPEIRLRQQENWLTEEMIARILISGVLEVVAAETYGFKHQTIQEYLAAIELVRRLLSQNQTLQDETWAFIWSKRTYSRWAEILRLVVGILFQTHRKESIQIALRWLHDLAAQRLADEDPGYLGLALAIQSLAEIAEAKTEEWREQGDIEVEVVTSWITELLNTTMYRRKVHYWMSGYIDTELIDTEKRKRLRSLAAEVRHLSSSTVSIAVEKLVEVLKQGERNSSIEAAHTLGELKANVPSDVLAAALESKYEDVRQTLVEWLGEYLPTTSLLEALSDPDREVCAQAQHWLEQRRELVPLEDLRAMMQNENTYAYIGAAQLLFQWGETIPVEPLVMFLKDKRWNVRFNAVYVIGTLGEHAPLGPLLFALGDEDWSVRRQTAFALGMLGAYVPIEQLVMKLSDTRWQVRSTAAEALGKLGELGSVAPLLEVLKDESERVRREAIRALGELGTRAPVEPLLAALNDEYMLSRMEAAEALGKLGAKVKVAAEPLIAALDDPEVRVRKAAAEALGKLDRMESIDSLLLKHSDHIWWIRAAAIQVLGKLTSQETVELLVTALDDTSGFIREAVVQAMGNLGEQAPIETLIATLHDKYQEVRSAAVETLGKHGERVPIEPLVTALRDKNWRVRKAAAEALGNLGERVPTEPLIIALQDDTEEVRRESAKALGKIRKQVPVEPLLAILHDKSWNVRKEVIWTLGELDARITDHLLLDALNDDAEEVRRTTVQTLGKLKKHMPIEVLEAELQNGDEHTRSIAAWALKEVGGQAHTELLEKALYDSVELVREGAVAALESVSMLMPIEPLAAVLNDSSWRVRKSAVHALGTLGTEMPVELLFPVLHDDVVSVRSEAVNVLGKLGELTPIEQLIQLVDDEEPDVRAAVIRALGEQGGRISTELFIAALGDSAEGVREAAATILQKYHANILLSIMPETIAVLHGQEPTQVFLSLKQCFLTEAIGNIGHASPELLGIVTRSLHWPYWEVRMNAAQALGKLRRNIPDAAIRSLLELRHDSQSRAVQEAADNALAAILSLETGIEDD